jgi:hypothetical protein
MSMWTKPCLDGKSHGYSSIEKMIQSTILACNVVKQHYNEVYFYTDKIGYEWITPYLDQLPFTSIEVVMDEINWLSNDYWSLCKIYVYSLQKKPFIHIDNDVFIWEKFPKEVTDKDFIFQEIEYFNYGYTFYLEAIDFYKDYIPKKIKLFDGAFNCGVFGCLTNKGLKLVEKYYEIAYNFIKSTNEVPSTTDGLKRKLTSVFIEQLFIYSLIMDSNLKFDTLRKYPSMEFKMKYTHQLSTAKRNEVVENMIRDRVYFKNWSCN